jgi:hypothetical protein
LENELKNVLQNNKIQLQNTSAMALSPKGPYHLLDDTLVIYSTDLATHKWKEAATEIRKIIKRETLKMGGNPTIKVEIRNE